MRSGCQGIQGIIRVPGDTGYHSAYGIHPKNGICYFKEMDSPRHMDQLSRFNVIYPLG